MNKSDSQKDILTALEKTEQQLIKDLGIAVQYEYAPEHINFFAPYFEIGDSFWKSVRYDFYKLICTKNGKPKQWLTELLTGDVRNLAAAIISLITVRYDVTFAIAFPATALIIKTGIISYCQRGKPKKIAKTVKRQLREKKQEMEKMQKEIKRLKKKHKDKNSEHLTAEQQLLKALELHTIQKKKEKKKLR